MNFRPSLLSLLILLLAFALAAPLAVSQNLTLGAIRGTVTDPSGAVVPGATVTAKQAETGLTRTATTNSTGAYNFALLPSGTYTVTVSSPNYQTASRTVPVTVGNFSTVNVQMAVKAAAQTVTVTAEGGVLQTVSPNVSTTMSSQQIQYVPNGGGDLSYIAQTAPGSVMNTQGGFGNFSSNGLAANTNNFTVNSMPENDPFLNLNNSGATNIMLGQNDISEATVVQSGYSGEYSMPGANVNYLSKSGTNSWHGNADWRWNGSYVNANNYFNKQNQPPTPRPFVNSNMWQASIGGPLRKDKTFFFVDTEGLYLVVPVAASVNIPSPAFQQATLANIASTQPASLPLYQRMFNIYNNAPGASSATPVNTSGPGADGGCLDFAGTAGFGPSNPCALNYNSTVNGNTHEWLIAGRVDQNIGNNDRAFVHFRMDRGLQATYTDPLTPIFNVTSFQPQYEGQLQWVHNFSPNTINSFSLNGSYYRAIFANPNQTEALALQPVELSFAGNAFYRLGTGYQLPFATPQGRNVTQYGFIDDVSHTMGNHTIKVGANLARYDITTYGPGMGTLPAAGGQTVGDFFNGVATNFTQSFPIRTTQPVNLYLLGFYGQDTWRARPSLNLTFAIRADRDSNPNCDTNCFSRFTGPFQDINHLLDTPYNQVVAANQGLALPSSFHPWTVQPRFGFNWSPFGTGSDLVVSGGFGLFAATLPAGYTDSLINNLPNDPTFTISGRPFDPAAPNNAGAAAAAAAVALRTGFANGATWSDINSAVLGTTGSPFSVPNFFNAGDNIHPPRVQKWGLQVQKGLGSKTAITLQYNGNHGIWNQINNSGLNAFCGPTNPVTAPPSSVLPACTDALGISSFAGLPAAPMDPRFLQVTEISSGYNNNYHGLTASFVRRFSSFQFQFNYTWSHALDEVSNAGQGITPFNDITNVSVTSPQNPFNVFQNMYGNADYDIRHYFSANYVYTTPRNWFHSWLGSLVGDWTIAGNIFARSGVPFTVQDTGTGSTLASYGYGGVNNTGATFANQTGGSSIVCGSEFANPVNGPCPGLVNNFVTDSTGFGNQRRNQVRGPNFFDTDLTINKSFKIPRWETGRFTIGATAYNLFNHPNFDQPVGDAASAQLGQILFAVSPPTSIYGSFLGADASPRVLQSTLKLSW